MLELSKNGNAWIAIVHPFSYITDFKEFKNPSSVPDHYMDLCRNKISYNGKIQGFTKSAIIREQNRGYSNNG